MMMYIFRVGGVLFSSNIKYSLERLTVMSAVCHVG